MGGNLFSIAFGRNLDAHSRLTETTQLPTLNSTLNHLSSNPSRLTTPSEPQCLDGRACYETSFYITIAACWLALALGIWAGWKDQRNHAAIALRPKAPAEGVWEDDGEE